MLPMCLLFPFYSCCWWIIVFGSIISSKKWPKSASILSIPQTCSTKYFLFVQKSSCWKQYEACSCWHETIWWIKHCKSWPMRTHSKRELFSTAGPLPEVPSPLESATSWAETFWVKNSASKYYACTKCRSWLLWLKFKLLKRFLVLSYSSHGQIAPIVCQN